MQIRMANYNRKICWKILMAYSNGKSNGKFVSNGNGNDNGTPMGGLGDGFDEEDDSFVFKSDVKVEKLSDEALRGWVTTFLLGLPTLGS